MPEPLSIFGSVTGFIGFIVTVRNSISTIINDVDAVKTGKNDLLPIAIRLTLIYDRIYHWQKFWKVYNGMPTTLFDSYWGSNSQLILKHLAQLHVKGEELYQEYCKIYHPESRDGGEDEETQIRTGHQAFNEGDEKRKLEDLYNMYKEQNNIIKRTNTALFCGPKFEKHLKKLEEHLELLSSCSKEFYISNADLEDDSDWKVSVGVDSNRAILTCLAELYWKTSSRLRRDLRDTDAYVVDLYLDHRIEPEKRIELLAQTIQNEHFKYDFCLLADRTPGLVGVDFSCTITGKAFESRLQKGEDHQNFKTVAPRLLDTSNPVGCTALRLQGHRDAPIFLMKKVTHEVPNARLERSQCLRSFMITHKADFEKSLHGRFQKEERCRLAYELAEWALVFLKTKWFQDLCSCCIYRIEAENLKTKFRVRICHVDHIDTDTGSITTVKNRQWCEDNDLLHMHIRRLGVLLVEIGTGIPVTDLNLDEKQGIEFEYDIDVENRDNTPTLNLRAINLKIQEAMGEDFKNAVDYCLRKGTTCQDIEGADLQDFHENVVEPLFRHYQELSIKGPARRKSRRDARRPVQSPFVNPPPQQVSGRGRR